MATNNANPDIAEALEAIKQVRQLRSEAFDGVDAASTEIDGARREVEDLADSVDAAYSEIERASQIARDLAGGSTYGMGTGTIEAAFDATERPFDILEGELGPLLDTIEEALLAAQAGGDTTAEVELDGVVYEMSLSRVGEAEDDTDLPDAFGAWLSDLMDDHDSLKFATIERESLVSETRLKAILDGEEPSGDEAPSILKMLAREDYITEGTRDRVESHLLAVEPAD